MINHFLLVQQEQEKFLDCELPKRNNEASSNEVSSNEANYTEAVKWNRQAVSFHLDCFDGDDHVDCWNKLFFSNYTRSISKMEFAHLNIEKYLNSFSEKITISQFTIFKV